MKFLSKRIVLAVSGSIAAYKAVSLLRELVREGADVTVVMTASARQFVTPLTFEVLSKHPVATDLFSGRQDMLHLTLPREADAFVVAPATANVLAKCALGLADDLLGAMILNAKCPIIFAPAMDGDMWGHPTVTANVRALRQRGITVLEPEEGPLASGVIGKGRLPEERAILAAIEERLCPEQDWVGRRVLVSAGPTQEAIDPVRFISNRSSGKMGYAIARAARERGAEVMLVSGPTSLTPPPGVEVEFVVTAEEMHKALAHRFSWATVVIMAAAVADFRPRHPSTVKLKKDRAPLTELEMQPTVDILENLSKLRTSQILVGFAAETQSVISQARKKLERKGLDLIVGNDVAAEGSGFGSDTNAAVLIDRQGHFTQLERMPKTQLAGRILDAVLELDRPTARAKRPRPSTRR